MEERDYAGVCGLYCGLCPRFQSTAPSRCLGCQLGPQHDYCSVYRCARKRGYWTCAECDEYPCERLLRLVGDGADSFLSHRPMLPNLERIREAGLDAHLQEQHERRLLAEQLIAEYNEGRSMTFYCTAVALLSPQLVREALEEMGKMLATGQVEGAEIKAKAKAMKALLQKRADQAGVSLKLRRKKDGA